MQDSVWCMISQTCKPYFAAITMVGCNADSKKSIIMVRMAKTLLFVDLSSTFVPITWQCLQRWIVRVWIVHKWCILSLIGKEHKHLTQFNGCAFRHFLHQYIYPMETITIRGYKLMEDTIWFVRSPFISKSSTWTHNNSDESS